MAPRVLAVIICVVGLLRAESFTHGGNGDGREHQSAIDYSAHKRMVYKKGDHLFNNVAKGFTNMIQGVFVQTPLKDFCTAVVLDKNLVVNEKISGIDISNRFPVMGKAVREYMTDQLLTTERDGLAVFDQKHQGADNNAVVWDETLKNLKQLTYEFIGQFMKTSLKGESVVHGKNAEKLDNIKNTIDQIINDKAYIDEEARTLFLNKNKNKLEAVNNVEQRTKTAISNLKWQINMWAVEAAKVYRNILNLRDNVAQNRKNILDNLKVEIKRKVLHLRLS